MKTLKIIGGALILGALLYFAYRADFYVWRLQHPTAPTWTYFWK